MTSLVIVDDQGMVRAGFRSLLDGEPGLEVVGEASDGEQAVSVVRRLQPDVTLMDIRMPVLDGLAATRRIVEEGIPTKVLVLTTFDLDEYVFEALRAGASGFLLKDAPAEELAAAVRTRGSRSSRRGSSRCSACSRAGSPTSTSPSGCSSPKAPPRPT